MIEITVTADGAPPQSYRFDGPEVCIGRGADNDLVLASYGSSRHHAKIIREGIGYRIVDLGSTNGLLYGSEVVRELPLADGTVVTIGDQHLTFSLPRETVPEATVRMFYGSPAAIPPEPESPPVPPALAPVPLYLVFGSGRGERSLKIAHGTEYIIGRSPSADLVLKDGECSKRHALICTRGDHFHIVDLESANGTYVGDERVRDAPISPGDEIVIGNSRVRVQDQIHDLVDRANLLEHTIRGTPALSKLVEPPGGERRSALSRPLTVALGVVAVLAIAAAAYFAGSRPRIPAPGGSAAMRPSPQDAGPSLVQVEPVRLRELVFDLSGSGTVEAQRRVTVSAEVSARVLEVGAQEGDWVEKGALLLRLGDRDISHQIEAARASLNREQVALARQDYQRKKRLFDDGAVVRSVVEQAESRYLALDSAYRSTQAKISHLEAQLAKTRVAAPISGVVTKLVVAEGEVVGPGTPIASLENMDEVLVLLKLADRDFVKAHRGQPVEATVAAFPGQVFKGEVSRLGSAADPVTRTFEVESRLRNPGLRLRPGLIVSLRIILERKGGLAIPAEAVSEQADGQTVVFVARDGIVQRRELTLGQHLDREIEVLEGLAEGESLVIVGHQGLRDGQAVETYTETPSN